MVMDRSARKPLWMPGDKVSSYAQCQDLHKHDMEKIVHIYMQKV